MIHILIDAAVGTSTFFVSALFAILCSLIRLSCRKIWAWFGTLTGEMFLLTGLGNRHTRLTQISLPTDELKKNERKIQVE